MLTSWFTCEPDMTEIGGQNKTALITGASSGIGAVFAQRLAGDGYDLIIHGRRRELLEALADRLRAEHGVAVEVLTAELASEKELGRLEDCIKARPGLEFLVNNAGYNLTTNFHEGTADEQDALLRVHGSATVRLAHAAIGVMKARGHGCIVNVSSIAGFLVSPKNAMYCATKAFLINLSESLHLELRGTGIRVQALCPGYTLTDFHRRLGYDPDDPRFKKFMAADTVVDRSLRDLARGKVICVPGWRYRLTRHAVALLPRWLFYRIILRWWSRRSR